ncbi:hypothetical protein SAMN05444161_7147 [Rhizobiales bacterium GAS191]|nr:hypothetical protein SAMN05444161_7147 [Rhizobiales bacterium GAS191]
MMVGEIRMSIVTALAFIVACPASAKELIACHFPASRDVIVSLDDRKIAGRMLNCIEGTFTHGMTPCAPNNAFGISTSNGTEESLQIVDRWQDHLDRDGSVVSSIVTSEGIFFEGFFLFLGQRDENGSWKFVINRLSGTAQLKEGNHPPLTFNCARVTPKTKSG